MEFILTNTEIFDTNLDQKVVEIISSTENPSHEKEYNLVISFCVQLLDDPRVEAVDVPIKKWEKNETKKDKIYNLLNYQLNKVDTVLCNKGYKIMRATIQGENLERHNCIKIELSELTPEENDYKLKKNSKKTKIKSVIPDLTFTRNTATKLAGKRLNEIYNDLMDIIRSKKIMSEALGIEETEDDNKLFQAFVEQYRDLWLATDQMRKVLLERLEGKIIDVLGRHENIQEQDSHRKEE